MIFREEDQIIRNKECNENVFIRHTKYVTEKEKSKFSYGVIRLKLVKCKQQQNLINDLIRAADGLQNLNTNANTQQLQNTQQHEYL